MIMISNVTVIYESEPKGVQFKNNTIMQDKRLNTRSIENSTLFENVNFIFSINHNI